MPHLPNVCTADIWYCCASHFPRDGTYAATGPASSIKSLLTLSPGQWVPITKSQWFYMLFWVITGSFSCLPCQTLPLNIPQFWSRFLLTGSGLESTASITLLHTVSRITAVVNIYWVLTILVRLEPLSPFYKWTQEPPPKITCSRSHSIGRRYKWKLLILTVPWYASGSEDGYHSHVKLSISTTI